MKKPTKPIVFIQGDKQFYRQNNLAQHILLKAMSSGITDPQELKKLVGLRTAADVFRTLDKLALRKEYHNALANAGVDFNYIVNGIREICDTTSNDSTKLKGFQTLLRSLGLDKYEKLEDTGKSWEETILALADASDTKLVEEAKKDEFLEADYEVAEPEMPEAEKKQREEEKELAKELYGSD